MTLNYLGLNEIAGERYDNIFTFPITDSTTITAKDLVELSSGKVIKSITTLSTSLIGMATITETMGVLATTGVQKYISVCPEGLVKLKGLVEGSGGSYTTDLQIGTKVSFHYDATAGYGQFVVASTSAPIGVIVKGGVEKSGDTDDVWDWVLVQLDFEPSGGGGDVPDLSISTAKLANASLTGSKFATGGISSSAYLGTGVVSHTKLADGAVGSSGKIADGIVTNSQIANGTLAGTKFAAGGINSSAYLDTGVVDSNQIAVGAVDSTHIAVGAITSTNIAVGGINSTNLATGLINSSAFIADGIITQSQLDAGIIVNGTITSSDQIVGRVIPGDNITVGGITSTNIAVGGVASTNLATGVINASGFVSDGVLNASKMDSSVPGQINPTQQYFDWGTFSMNATEKTVTVDFSATLSSTTGVKLFSQALTKTATIPIPGSVTVTSFVVSGTESQTGNWMAIIPLTSI